MNIAAALSVPVCVRVSGLKQAIKAAFPEVNRAGHWQRHATCCGLGVIPLEISREPEPLL